MEIVTIRTRVFLKGESLFKFITEHISHLDEKDVLVVTSKIVALAEGRVAPSGEKVALIKRESEWSLQTKYAWLTIKDGMFMAGAGIDESNAEGKIILLPKDSFKIAGKLRAQLRRHYGIKKLGVLITDSRVIPLRAGVVGVALGYAGFSGIRDYRGTPDIFGRTLHITRTNIADSLATAAVLEMGEGQEQLPLAIAKKASIEFRERINKDELKIPLLDDLYAPLFASIIKKDTHGKKKRR